jgi:hypothetical protein
MEKWKIFITLASKLTSKQDASLERMIPGGENGPSTEPRRSRRIT